jgi:hypothetical protein
MLLILFILNHCQDPEQCDKIKGASKQESKDNSSCKLLS